MTVPIEKKSSTRNSKINHEATITFDSTDEVSSVDEENPRTKSDLLQAQSKQLTQSLISRTELAYHYDDLDDTDDPRQNVNNRSSSLGFLYWKRQIQNADEHGGDYATRLMTATRTALGSGLVFSALIFPDLTDALGMVWVGNIWYHVNISDSLGAAIPNVLYFARSTVLTTLFSWPFALLFNYLKHEDNEDDLIVTILFPIVIFLVSFVILTCPQITSNTLMVVVMFIVLAAPIANPMYWLKPFGWVATYFICLAIALLMNLVPFPNLAMTTTRQNLNRLENDLTMLLLAIKDYSNNNGTNVKLARKAISTMEFMYTRIFETVLTLQNKLPATQVEFKLLSCKSHQDGLVAWVKHSATLLEPLKFLRSALMQKVLGEESTYSSPTLGRAKVVLNQEISPSRDRLVNAMIASVAVCHAWADPTKSNATIFPNVQEELQTALHECQRSFHKAVCKAADEMGSSGSCNQRKEHQSLFAHLTRRMSAFHSLFALAESLLSYLEHHEEDGEWKTSTAAAHDKQKKSKCSRLSCGGWCSDLRAYLTQPWKWRDQDQLRIAFKTSVGMVFAAFFVSMPYLKELSTPYGVWPGITVASISMSSRGSSFHRAADRLMATMIGGAFSMIVADLFPGNNNVVKIGSLTIFSFVMIYLRDANHAYMYTYSCITIGCMLFGSVATDYDIVGYVPKRIELIFVGVLIFALVELSLFPRSSRKIVEATSLEFIMTTRDFLQQAVKCSHRMEKYVIEYSSNNNNNNQEYWKSSANKETINFHKQDDPFDLSKLKEEHAKLKEKSAKLSSELNSAIGEPSLGLGIPLHPASFRGLVANEKHTERQAGLLCNALEKLAEFYQQGDHPIRDMSSNWPHVHTVFLQDAADSMEHICTWLDTVFVDGRIRAQRGNSVKAVNAASSFRSLEDVRLKIISEWSDSFEAFVHQNGFEDSDPHAIMTLGITTTVILELCEHMQKAGKNMEEIAYRFPTFH